MSISKKILIAILIITILMPFLSPIHVIGTSGKSDWSDEYPDDNTTKGLTKAQQKFVQVYVRAYLQESYKFSTPPVVYNGGAGSAELGSNPLYSGIYYQNNRDMKPITQIGSNGRKSNGEAYSNKIELVCSSFTASMLYHSLGVDIAAECPKGIDTIRGAGFSSPLNRGKGIFQELKDTDYLQPGDIIAWQNYGHSMIYIGPDEKTGHHQIAETCGNKVIGITNLPVGRYKDNITVAELKGSKTNPNAGGNCYGHIARLIPSVVQKYWKGVPDKIQISWPDGSISTVDPNDISVTTVEYDMSQPLFYQGIANPIGSAGVYNNFERIIKAIRKLLSDILDYILGFITLMLRAPFVGLAYISELIVSSAMQVVSAGGASNNITIESIIFNQIPIFDINIFNFEEAGGAALSAQNAGQNVILAVRENIAGWYYAFRYITIVAMLVILVYLGLRMAITTIAEEKAHYKRMLVDWLVSFLMVMFIHYFLVIVLNLNDFLINILKQQLEQSSGLGSVYNTMRILSHSIRFTDGWYGTIVYIALVILMVKYTWKYSKRMLSGYILIMLSPLVSISYALDKIKDNRSQSFSKWMKEVIYTVLIQSAHALIYTVFVAGIITPIASGGGNMLAVAGELVFLIIAIKFMDAAESIFKNIFGFESSSIVKETMNTTFEAFAKFKMATGVARTYFKGVGRVLKGGMWLGGKTMHFIGDHNKVANKAVTGWDSLKQGIKDGYLGKELRDTNGALGNAANSMIAGDRKKTENINNKSAELARKSWNSMKSAVKGVGMGLVRFTDNPMSSLSSIITGVILAKNTFKMARRGVKNKKLKNSYRTTESMTGKGIRGTLRVQREQIKREQLAFELDRKAIILEEKLDELYSERNSLLVTVSDERATAAEKRDSKNLNALVLRLLSENSKTIGSRAVIDAINKRIMQTTTAGNSNLEVRDLINAVLMQKSGTEINEDVFYRQFGTRLHKTMFGAYKSKSETAGTRLLPDIEEKLKTIEKEVEAEGLKEGQSAEQISEQVDKRIAEEITEFLNYEYNQVDILNQLDSNTLAGMVIESAEEARKIKTDEVIELNNEKSPTTFEQIIDAVQKGNKDVKIDKVEFVNHFKEELQNMILRKMTSGSSISDLKFGVKLQGKMNRATSSAWASAKRLNLIGEEANRYVQERLDEAVSNYLDDEANLQGFMESLDNDELTIVLTSATNYSDITSRKTKISVEDVSKTIESARNDQTISIDSILTEIERSDPRTKVDKEKVKSNIRVEIEKAMLNIAMDQPESIQTISFGEDLSKAIEESKDAYNLTKSRLYTTDGLIKDDLKAEMQRQMQEAIKKFLDIPENYQKVLEDISSSDYANVLTRAINGNDAIKRLTVESAIKQKNVTSRMRKELLNLKEIIKLEQELRMSYVDVTSRLDYETVPEVVDRIRKEAKEKADNIQE